MRPPARIPRTLPAWNRKPNERKLPQHRGWIATLPCAVCGRVGYSVAAHIRAGVPDEHRGGMGFKPNDRLTIPLCDNFRGGIGQWVGCHNRQHESEVSFWAALGVDPVDIAYHLFSVSGNTAAGERAVARFQQSIALHKGEIR